MTFARPRLVPTLLLALVVALLGTACGSDSGSSRPKSSGRQQSTSARKPRAARKPKPPVQQTTKTPPPVSPTTTTAAVAIPAEARTVYQNRCTPCHGPTGQGDGAAAVALDPKPRNYADRAWQAEVTDEELRKVILAGGQAAGLSALMPASPDLESKPEVVDGIIALIRTFDD
ncbi:MAG: c-type cytochrome [Acidobacteriota bacterium]